MHLHLQLPSLLIFHLLNCLPVLSPSAPDRDASEIVPHEIELGQDDEENDVSVDHEAEILP